MARVLIADDSDAIRLILRDILEIEKHEIVSEAKDGDEAIQQYLEFVPDVILLDLAMPKKDGLTVVKEIIKNDPDAKIILITASEDQKVIHECIASGAKSYISKPFDFKNILNIISNIDSL